MVQISTAAPMTSPVTPPNRLTNRRTAKAVTTSPAIAAITSATTSLVLRSSSTSPRSTPSAMTAAVSSAATLIGTAPATRAPSPSARAARTSGVQHHVAASREVVTARISATVPAPTTEHSVSAAIWMMRVSTTVITPNAPMSGARMTSSRRALVAVSSDPLTPMPSAVSARPSRWSPRVRYASALIASAAATKSTPSCGRVPGAIRRTKSRTIAASEPSARPTSGARVIACRAVRRSMCSGLGTRIDVSVPNARRSASGITRRLRAHRPGDRCSPDQTRQPVRRWPSRAGSRRLQRVRAAR